MTFLCEARRSSSVVHFWLSGLTYCRSSSQIGQCAGGRADSANCVPQVTHRYVVPPPGPSAAAAPPCDAESTVSAAADVEASFMKVRRVPFRPMIESSPDLAGVGPISAEVMPQPAYPKLWTGRGIAPSLHDP